MENLKLRIQNKVVPYFLIKKFLEALLPGKKISYFLSFHDSIGESRSTTRQSGFRIPRLNTSRAGKCGMTDLLRCLSVFDTSQLAAA